MPAVGSALRNSVQWKTLTMLLVLVSMSCSRISYDFICAFIRFGSLRSDCRVTGKHVLPAGASAPVGKQEAESERKPMYWSSGLRKMHFSFSSLDFSWFFVGVSRRKNNLFFGKPYADEDGLRLWYCVHRNELDLLSLGQNMPKSQSICHRSESKSQRVSWKDCFPK